MLKHSLKKGLIALSLAACFALPLQAKVITDVEGNKIELPDNVQRVADLWHANNQIVLLLGGANKLVGTTTTIAANPWYSAVYPNIKNVPVLTNGETIQTEELLSHKPDAVLLSKKSMLTEVEQEGLKGVRVSFQDFDGLKKTVCITAEVLGGKAPEIAENYIKELSKLQSSVPPLNKEEVMTAIRRELPSGLSDSFLDFSEEPLASGSVAQTHRARLLSGQEVIVKIQRPGIDEVVKEDIQLLIKLARHIPKHFIPMVDVQEVLENLRETLIKELDFRNEAEAMKRFKANNRAVACLGVPKVYDTFTTPHLIVEEYIDGIPLNDYSQLLEAGYDLEDVGKKLMLSFIKQVFKDGYFHGDPHPGNLLVRDGKICFIDFGIMGELEVGMRASLNDILYSFTAQDVDGMTKAILSVTQFDNGLNRAVLSQDVEQMLGRYSGVDLGSLSMTDLLEDLLAIFQKNHLKASSQITILEKASLQIEGIFRELAPNMDLMTLAKDYFLENMGPDMLKQALNKESILIELFYLIRNGKNIPRRLHQLLEQILNGRIVVNHDFINFSGRIKVFEKVLNNLVLALLTLGFLLSGALLANKSGFENLAWLFLGLGTFLALITVVRIIFKKKG